MTIDIFYEHIFCERSEILSKSLDIHEIPNYTFYLILNSLKNLDQFLIFLIFLSAPCDDTRINFRISMNWTARISIDGCTWWL